MLSGTWRASRRRDKTSGFNSVWQEVSGFAARRRLSGWRISDVRGAHSHTCTRILICPRFHFCPPVQNRNHFLALKRTLTRSLFSRQNCLDLVRAGKSLSPLSLVVFGRAKLDFLGGWDVDLVWGGRRPSRRTLLSTCSSRSRH